MNLGERYRNLRLSLKDEKGKPLSTKEFAENFVKLSAPRVSELENNKREMSLTELKAYHKCFGVSFEYLLGETDVKTINNDIQTACQVTGLSERALNVIRFETMYQPEPNIYSSDVIVNIANVSDDVLSNSYIDNKVENSKEICDRFLSSIFFHNVIVNISDAISYYKKGYNFYCDMEWENSNMDKKALLSAKKHFTKFMKVDLIETLNDLSKFVEEYAAEEVKKEREQYGEYNPENE